MFLRRNVRLSSAATIQHIFAEGLSTGEMDGMRGLVGLIAMGVWMAGSDGAAAATKMSPNEIQASFFNGQAFTASTPSNIKFTMVFKPDGKVTREPVGKSGVKGEGTWKLSKDGFCTTWKGSKANCFTLISKGNNEWSVVKGAATVATWNK
jgi:hypothetical protein